jgi:hypothetical protein
MQIILRSHFGSKQRVVSLPHTFWNVGHRVIAAAAAAMLGVQAAHLPLPEAAGPEVGS